MQGDHKKRMNPGGGSVIYMQDECHNGESIVTPVCGRERRCENGEQLRLSR
jgi:hypothetical protein